MLLGSLVLVWFCVRLRLALVSFSSFLLGVAGFWFGGGGGFVRALSSNFSVQNCNNIIFEVI